MRVVPLAVTQLIQRNEIGDFNLSEWMNDSALDADVLAEFAGRSCYESFDKPNPKTRANKDYLAHILEVGHESVLEHASVTFYIRDISRSLTHELVRHRHLSFSQRSQRYVDESAMNIVLPPDITNDPIATNMLQALEARAKSVYTALVQRLAEGPASLPRKRARSAARAALLGSQSTAIVVTGNMRAWRHVIQMRNHPSADLEIQELAKLILGWCKYYAPHTFQDLD